MDIEMTAHWGGIIRDPQGWRQTFGRGSRHVFTVVHLLRHSTCNYGISGKKKKVNVPSNVQSESNVHCLCAHVWGS